MNVPGTQVSAEDTATGAAVTFTTRAPEQVPALRERVRAMAKMHDRHHAAGEAGHGMHGKHGMHGMHGSPGAMAGMEMPPASQTSVEDVPEGARILVTPKDPADLQKLQATVRQHASHMQEHGCPMMDHAPHGS